MADDYARKPLILPLNDGGTEYDLEPVLADQGVVIAERFRRQGKELIWPSYGPQKWGRDLYPVRLRLDDSVPFNYRIWWRDAEPLDLSSYLAFPASWIPHGYWVWRIAVEPKGIVGALYEVDNPSSPGGASVMAEDLITKEGVLSNLPNPFSAPNQHFSRRGNLQVGITTDGGTSYSWSDLVWN